MSILQSLLILVAVAFSFTLASAGGDAVNGEKLYNSKLFKCKVCHKMTEKKKIGPGLAGISGKRSEAWLIKMISEPQKTWEENDAETQEMKKWKKGRADKKKTKMKMKKNPTEAETLDIIAYMKANGG